MPIYQSPDPVRAEEFRHYLGAVLADRRARGWYWSQAAGIQFPRPSRKATSSRIRSTDLPRQRSTAAPANDEGSIVVTGSRARAPANHSVSAVTTVGADTSNPNITNNQMRNVEEGDIVKQIGHHLLVLQDGRIFVIDIRGGGGRRLVLADRMNVYRDPRHHMWYDEMLVFGDRILVTGYSYREDATELSVFRLDQAGRLNREGVFYVSSNDYYDSSNYATRLIGDNLVIYTPFSVASNRRLVQMAGRAPLVGRRERDEALRRAVPVRRRRHLPAGPRLDNPTVHSVSVCRSGPVGGTRPRMSHHRLRRADPRRMVCDRNRCLPLDLVAGLVPARHYRVLRTGPRLRFRRFRAGAPLSGSGRRRGAGACRGARGPARSILAPRQRRPLPRLAQAPCRRLP